MDLRRLSLLLALAAIVAIAVGASGSAGARSECDMVAAPSGGDYRSAEDLVANLPAGETGCFRTGTYRFDELKVTRPGVTLTSYPGERAQLVGRVWVARGADGVNISHLDLDGRVPGGELPSPTINAHNATFDDVDVTNNHTAICFALGQVGWGEAVGTTIENSRIHDCGELPSTNQDHGIYLSWASDTIIRNNWIYGNADRGIQLYPDAQHTKIVGNVINGNGVGVIFSGDDQVAASDNVVAWNIISNSDIRRNVESSYAPGGPIGQRNLVLHNCIHGAPGWYGGADDSGIQRPETGFDAHDNVNAAPEYVGAADGDLNLSADSPCSSFGPGAGARARERSGVRRNDTVASRR